MNLQTFIDALATGSGASYSLTEGKPTTGIMASIHGYEYTSEFPSTFVRYKRELQREMIAGHVKDYVGKHGVMLESPDKFLGGWWSKGKLFLDVSMRFEATDMDTAVVFGMNHGQKAIYSIDLDKEYELPMAQEHGTETQKATYIHQQADRISNDYNREYFSKIAESL